MKHLLILSLFSLLLFGCDGSTIGGGDNNSNNTNNSNNINNHNPMCDDGTTPICDMLQLQCEEPLILAYQNDCYVCVVPQTCEPPEPAQCDTDLDCADDEFCNPCGASSCPECDDCVAVCAEHGCPSESELQCWGVRPECGAGNTAVIQDGCWVCVDYTTCEEVRPEMCDDGSEVLCDMIEPTCDEGEILAVYNGCWRCVNPATCVPWGYPTCTMDADCGLDEYCSDCATGSCSGCEDCVAGCLPHECATGAEPACNRVRPTCAYGSTAVVRDGCWICVDSFTCEEVRDSTCDDGTQPLCDMMEPQCDEEEILAWQNECYACVNPVTCEPWGSTPGCETDSDCSHLEYCDLCATSSGPLLADCVAGCMPHGCETEPIAMCNTLRPECGEGNTAVITGECYQCVDLADCLPLDSAF